MRPHQGRGVKGAIPSQDVLSILRTLPACALKQVVDVVKSYGISILMDEYHSGSRAWLYQAVNAWLDLSVGDADAGERSSVRERASRAFILLAGPGMGKSVFSAVMQTKLAVRANKDQGLVMVSGAGAGRGRLSSGGCSPTLALSRCSTSSKLGRGGHRAR